MPRIQSVSIVAVTILLLGTFFVSMSEAYLPVVLMHGILGKLNTSRSKLDRARA